LVVSLPHLKASKAPKYRVPCSQPWKDPFRNIARGWGPIPWTLWLRRRIGLFGKGVVSTEARDCKAAMRDPTVRQDPSRSECAFTLGQPWDRLSLHFGGFQFYHRLGPLLVEKGRVIRLKGSPWARHPPVGELCQSRVTPHPISRRGRAPSVSGERRRRRRVDPSARGNRVGGFRRFPPAGPWCNLVSRREPPPTQQPWVNSKEICPSPHLTS
jgi:hypothetical protein